LLDQTLELADWDGFPARQAESRARGRLRGRGISDYLELTGPPGREMGGIRFEADGTVTIITGTLDHGQGRASAFARALAARLGVAFEDINLLQGDADELLAGGGTEGPKSLMASGTAIIEAAERVRENGRKIAATGPGTSTWPPRRCAYRRRSTLPREPKPKRVETKKGER